MDVPTVADWRQLIEDALDDLTDMGADVGMTPEQVRTFVAHWYKRVGDL